jgi:hypothetical protein
VPAASPVAVRNFSAPSAASNSAMRALITANSLRISSRLTGTEAEAGAAGVAASGCCASTVKCANPQHTIATAGTAFQKFVLILPLSFIKSIFHAGIHTIQEKNQPCEMDFATTASRSCLSCHQCALIAEEAKNIGLVIRPIYFACFFSNRISMTDPIRSIRELGANTGIDIKAKCIKILYVFSTKFMCFLTSYEYCMSKA